MQEFIVNETNKIFSKAIERFSKADKVEKEEVSILLYLKEEGDDRETAYKLCHHHVPVKEITIMNVLGVRIDLKGYSILVPPQIKKIIENFELEHNSKNIEVCVYLDREDDGEVRYFLYKDAAFLSEFKLEDVLKFEMT